MNAAADMVTKHLLLNVLEDLVEDRFQTFKFYLHGNIKGLSAIPKCDLEKARREKTVDLMMETYTHSVVKVMKIILKMMNMNDLVNRLSQAEEAEIQKKIEEINHSVRISKEDADKEKAEGVQVFTALRKSVERGMNELIKEIEEKQKTTEKQAEGFIKELEKEISEVEQLSWSQDHIHLLQSIQSLKASPPTKNWTEVRVCPPSYEGSVERAVAQLEEMIKKVAELKKVQQFAVDVTLDPDTAHRYLILSSDGKRVSHSTGKKRFQDNPERFSYSICVLGKNSFCSGRFYFEVQVKGKTEWNLGVARESVNRKGIISRRPQDGFWIIWLRNENTCEALENPPVLLTLKSPPEKVGVFVDYEEGLVSFYDVDAAVLIYSFTGCSFTQKLYPFFSPCKNDGGKNSSPLIICPVSQTD